ncbi:MAG: hypothetical protein IJP13_03990 [Lachnospiraceae bacterium]|nr:hypothetical protein [Lachnospiraceae bacterium]
MLWKAGFFITDRSAVIGIEDMTWQGKTYSTISGEYTEGRTIAKSEDGRWDINEVEEDPSHNFVVVRSFLDQQLYVADQYVIPTSGKVTSVCWADNYICDQEFLAALSEIDEQKVTSFKYVTEGIYAITENQQMKEVYFAYENCPVATNYKGYMGKVNGQWVITTYISPDQRRADGSPKKHSVSCYFIPVEYSSILEKYFVK